MRKVLHVGPCDTPGGMATVMHTLAENPPDGWQSELLASHAEGSVWKKWKAYRAAHKHLKNRCNNGSNRPDVIHFHVAADWSWRRKARLLHLAHHHNVPSIVHLHSGQLDAWVNKGGAKRQKQVRSVLEKKGVLGVVLSTAWNERLSPLLGPLEVVHNPLPRHNRQAGVERETDCLLLLGRDDPVKGHAFAVGLVEVLRPSFPNLRLMMTGVSQSSGEGVHALGWVSEEKKNSLLARASILLIPSAFEGQPVVALEALSAGLPVCASDRVVGLPETVKTAAFDNLEAWAGVVADMLRNPPKEKRLVSSVTPYSVGEVQHRWKTLYESL